MRGQSGTNEEGPWRKTVCQHSRLGLADWLPTVLQTVSTYNFPELPRLSWHCAWGVAFSVHKASASGSHRPFCPHSLPSHSPRSTSQTFHANTRACTRLYLSTTLFLTHQWREVPWSKTEAFVLFPVISKGIKGLHPVGTVSVDSHSPRIVSGCSFLKTAPAWDLGSLAETPALRY